MDAQVTSLVDSVWEKFQETRPTERFMIAIGGIPGSGKTTLSQLITNKLNTRHATLNPSDPAHTTTPIAAFVPMDGYHLTRAQLSAMPDPATAHARRGAEFTFDGASFLELVKALKQPITSTTQTIYAPSFDHAVKDPKENDIPVLPSHRIVVFEGNYVCLAKEPWSQAAAQMDQRWFVNVDFDVAKKRLIRRHVKAGIAADETEAAQRADNNDLVNGRNIVDNRVALNVEITSREDQSWVHE